MVRIEKSNCRAREKGLLLGQRREGAEYLENRIPANERLAVGPAARRAELGFEALETEVMQSVGLREIREARMADAKRYTAKAVAEAVGVSRPTYAKIEKDPSRMTRAQAERAAALLNCDVNELFYLPEEGN